MEDVEAFEVGVAVAEEVGHEYKRYPSWFYE